MQIRLNVADEECEVETRCDGRDETRLNREVNKTVQEHLRRVNPTSIFARIHKL